MAIYRLIANGSFGPDEIKVMIAAYEGALIDLSRAVLRSVWAALSLILTFPCWLRHWRYC
jgi:hypothetical protein